MRQQKAEPDVALYLRLHASSRSPVRLRLGAGSLLILLTIILGPEAKITTVGSDLKADQKLCLAAETMLGASEISSGSKAVRDKK